MESPRNPKNQRVCVSRRRGQRTQLHYLSESTDTAGQTLLYYKWKLWRQIWLK